PEHDAAPGVRRRVALAPGIRPPHGRPRSLVRAAALGSVFLRGMEGRVRRPRRADLLKLAANGRAISVSRWAYARNPRWKDPPRRVISPPRPLVLPAAPDGTTR